MDGAPGAAGSRPVCRAIFKCPLRVAPALRGSRVSGGYFAALSSSSFQYLRPAAETPAARPVLVIG